MEKLGIDFWYIPTSVLDILSCFDMFLGYPSRPGAESNTNRGRSDLAGAGIGSGERGRIRGSHAVSSHHGRSGSGRFTRRIPPRRVRLATLRM